MRPPILFVLCALVVLACAWSKEDHEIFRLRDEVEKSEGEDVSFYDFLGVTPSATHDDIQKAFRKKSRALHPDKVKHSFIASKSTAKPKPKSGAKKQPGVHVSKGPSQREIKQFVNQATERYGRLGVVAEVLRGPGRERYDHFLKNGFPKWRGTGYYYTRFRPGLGSVLIGLFIFFGGAAHYGAMVLSWKRQQDFVHRYIRHARKSAWGDESGIRGIASVGVTVPSAPPQPTEEPDQLANMNRRQKREMERQNKKESKSGKKSRTPTRIETPPPETDVTPEGEKRRVLAENGKVLIVDSIGNVFLEEQDEDGNAQLFQLDPDEIPRPTFRDTAVYKLPIWLYRKAASPFVKSTTPVSSGMTAEQEGTAEMDIVVQSEKPREHDSSQDSGESFELIDSTGMEKDMGTAKKRGKKGKK